jgi:hypothetical protein
MKAKPIVTALLLAFVVASVGYLVLRENTTSASSGAAAAATTAPGAARFVAYYFHNTRRCFTCKTIEAQSKEAINTGFAEELKQGRLAWLTVNLEEPGNAHYATDYGVAGSALVIAEVKDGKPVRFAKLDKTWDLVRNKPVFMDYVATETMAFLGAKR